MNRFYWLVGTSALLSCANYAVLTAQGSDADLELHVQDKSLNKPKYERCRYVEQPNGFFKECTDQEEYCDR